MQLPPCYLEVLVNGEETFCLTKQALIPRSGLLVRLLNASAVPMEDQTEASIVRLDNVPGGAQAFELVARYCCFIEGRFRIDETNVVPMRLVAEFLEMTDEEDDLFQQTETFLSGMPFWSLQQCMNFLHSCELSLPDAWNTQIVHQCVELLSAQVITSCSSDSTPVCFSPESRNPSENRSSEMSPLASLYDEMTLLSSSMMEKVVSALISNRVDSKFLARCLLHYLQSTVQRNKSVCLARKPQDMKKELSDIRYTQKICQSDALETVVSLLHSLEWSSVSCKSLFGLHRLAASLHATKRCRKQIEEMIASQLHKATLDNILVASGPHRCGCLYDVDLILRLVKKFLPKQPGADVASEKIVVGRMRSGSRTEALRTVGDLLDMYLAEIAPDPSLGVAKFKAVAECLPDDARDSHDQLYTALDIYLEAHPRIPEEEATELCKVINFRKLSFEASKHVAQSLRFPARLTLQVLLVEQANLKATMEGNLATRPDSCNCQSSSRFPTSFSTRSSSCSNYDPNMLVENPDELEYDIVLRQNKELKSDLLKMQSRVKELEKVCGQMRSRVSKYMKMKLLLC